MIQNKNNWPLGGNWSLSQDAFRLKNNKIEKKQRKTSHRCCRVAQGPDEKCSWRVTWVQGVDIIFYYTQSLLSWAYFQRELMWLLQSSPLLLVGEGRSWFGWHPVCSSSRTRSAATVTARIRAPLLKSGGESACCRQSSDWRESLPFKVLQQQLWPCTWLFLPKCLVLHTRQYETEQNSRLLPD